MDIDLAPVSAEDLAQTPALGPLRQGIRDHGQEPPGVPFSFESSMTKVLVRDEGLPHGVNHNSIDVNIASNMWFTLGTAGASTPPRRIRPCAR